MKHFFEIDLAKELGIHAAILLENIGYWIKQNEANEKNFYDGEYWTYNSRRAYKELFPYMSERQINTAFSKLIDGGYIITGNYNKLAYDRTLWYALTQKGKCILHFDIMESDNMSNGECQNGEPIPDIKPDITQKEKTNNNIDYEAEFEKLWTLYPCKRGKSQVSKKAMKELAKAGFDVVSKAIENYKKEVEDIRQNSFNQQWLNGSTFFNGRWKDYVTANEPTFPDGRKEVEYEDGSKIIYFPNGKVLDVDPYGLSHELLPHEIEELKEGRYK